MPGRSCSVDTVSSRLVLSRSSPVEIYEIYIIHLIYNFLCNLNTFSVHYLCIECMTKFYLMNKIKIHIRIIFLTYGLYSFYAIYFYYLYFSYIFRYIFFFMGDH